MATINPDKFKENLRKMVINVLEAGQQSVTEGMLLFSADFKQRIFQDGLDADNNQIGNYSTKPIYISIAGNTSQVRKSGLKPKGKNSSKDFKDGKKRKSQYMPGGYKEYRAVVGRQNQKVDLFLTGSLRGSIQVGQSAGSTTLGFLNDEQLVIAQGNQDRFGKTIFVASDQEVNKIVTDWEDAVTDAFFKSFE